MNGVRLKLSKQLSVKNKKLKDEWSNYSSPQQVAKAK
jgi:hypothetical protein